MKYLLPIYMFLFCLTACVQEIGELTEYEAPRLIVNSIFAVGDTTISVDVRMMGVTETRFVSDAQVTLRVNDGASYSLLPDERFRTYRLNDVRLSLQPGDRVEVYVQGGGQHVSASSIVQQPVIIAGMDTCTSSFPYNLNGMVYDHTRCLVHLQMPENVDDMQYYRVEVVRKINVFKSDAAQDSSATPGYSTWPMKYNFYYGYDPALHEGHQLPQEKNDHGYDWFDQDENYFAVFRSVFFEQGRYTLTLDLERPNNTSAKQSGWEQTSTIRLYTISRTEFEYYKVLSAFVDYEPGLIFNSEPVFPTNIEGGTGIFGVESKAEITLYEKHLPSTSL